MLMPGLGIAALFLVGCASLVLGIIFQSGGVMFLGGGTLLILVMIWATGLERFNREQGASLIRYLHMAVRLNLPLADYLDQVARGERGLLQRQAKSIALHLRAGLGLGDVLMKVPTELPRHQAALIWRGEACGQVRPALDRLIAQTLRRDKDRPGTMSSTNVLAYAAFVLAVLCLVTAYMNALIIPKFVEIANDFDVPLPWITLVTFRTLGAFAFPLGLLAGAAMLWMIGWTFYRAWRGSRKMLDPLRRWFEPVVWRVPILSAGHRSRAYADACFLIAQAMRAGQPLPEAVHNAATPVISRVLSDRLGQFGAALERGLDPADAARAAGLPGLFAGMFKTAEHSGDPAEVFEYLTRFYDSRSNPLEAALRAAALPAVTLALALLTGWLVLAIFYPLVSLIEATNAGTGYY